MGIYVCCLCCLTIQTPNCLENSILLQTVIGIVFFIIGYASFPWSSIGKNGGIVFSVDFICMLFCFIVVIYLKILRKNNLINTTKNKTAVVLSCIAIGINTICIIFSIIAQSIIITNSDNVRKTCKMNAQLGIDENCAVKSGHIIAECIVMSVIDIIWIVKVLFWFIDNKLISLQINFSYENYKNAGSINNIEKEVKIMPVNADAVFLGNDPYGRPIYAPQYAQQPITPYQGADINANVNDIGSRSDLARKNIPINPLDQDVQSEKASNNENHY